MKDRFSDQAKAYSNFRPEYPVELYNFIFSKLQSLNCAWDCGTGNGQVAYPLAQRFAKVYGTDISAKQLENAKQHTNITYLQVPAEITNFEAASFDLVTVAQAIHWFNFDAFYAEVKRVIKPNGYLAVIGYGLMQTEAEMQTLILDFYTKTVGEYWDKERRYIDENYATIPFPFSEIEVPNFSMKYKWTAAQLLGYLSTWSACKNYEKARGQNPLELISRQVRQICGEAEVQVIFPILFRMGCI